MQTLKFRPYHLEALLFDQVRLKRTPEVFWIMPLDDHGSVVYTNEKRNDQNPERFRYFK